MDNSEIKANQIWVAYVKGKPHRRLRILAPHPDGGWIYKDEPAALKHVDYTLLRHLPEYNLRYVFTLERDV